MEIINKNIGYLRRSRGWTQKQLADKLGITRSTVAAYEEYRATPPLAKLKKLAATFEIDFERFIHIDLEIENRIHNSTSFVKI